MSEYLFGGGSSGMTMGDIMDIGGAIYGRKGAQDQINANIEMMHAQNAFSAFQAEKQRGWTSRQLQRQREFQLNSSNTAIRRRMRDLKAGGLNPILAGKWDASSPMGGMGAGATGQAAAAAPIENVAQSALDGLRKTNEYRMFKENLKNVKEQRKNIQADTYKKTEEGKRVSTTIPPLQLTAEVAERLIDALKVGTGNNPQPFSALEQAIEKSEQAKKIRETPGIEVTDHVRNRAKRGRNRTKKRY